MLVPSLPRLVIGGSHFSDHVLCCVKTHAVQQLDIGSLGDGKIGMLQS